MSDRVWTDGVNWVVAATAADAFTIACAWHGANVSADTEDWGVKPLGEWRALPDDRPLTCEDPDGEPVTWTCAEWASRAPGYLGSSEY